MAGEDTRDKWLVRTPASGGRFVFGEDTEHLLSDIIYQPRWGMVYVQPVCSAKTLNT
jgi:hypothetical protein